ncbi:hypothetical protein HY448_01040 [Candidatus Pacearchaeota archaeon]|nr:hypothetical protein [Candidatus Pacearchaeota archaeon]
MRNNSLGNSRAQLTIFIIIAIVIVGSIATFFALRGYFLIPSIPETFQPAYTNFLSCIEQDTLTGIALLENQAGYIYLPEFELGSNHMPFSSQLDFLGNPIPYWYYVSGNNIEKEQVPAKADIEKQLEIFVSEKIKECNFGNYYEQGYEIYLGNSSADVQISDNKVSVLVYSDLSMVKEEDSVSVSRHSVNVNSELGKLYNAAKEVYDNEQKNLFLENYTIDMLGLYAPVDGVELSCSPVVWDGRKVFEDLQNAIYENTQSITTKNDLNSESDYFVGDIRVDADVRFYTSKDWPYSFEVVPTQGQLLLATPIGNQPGLGILGFCYVPYHFVYNVKYPVLVQVFSGNEIFQFPVALVIQGNKPRHALDATAVEISLPEICDKNNTEIKVNLYDTKLNPVNSADISYECFGTKCEIGKANSGVLTAGFPQCANGDIIARANGFKETRHLYSTINSGSVDVVMDRIYEMGVNLNLDGANYDGQATISFFSQDGSFSSMVSYPEQKTINLSEGQYEVQVYIYQNSSITLGKTTTKQCIEVPQSAIGGLFGFTKEKCFDIEFPEQIISNALSGGGKQNYYILESELSNHKTISINANKLPTPNSIEQLNNNYLLFEKKGLVIGFG